MDWRRSVSGSIPWHCTQVSVYIHCLSSSLSHSVSIFLGLWAYDGWNSLNVVAGEMKDPHRDLPRVIFFGIPLVILSYLLANVAYLGVLRPQVLMHTNTVAMDFGKKVFGPVGGILFAVCVALSCFGVGHH